MATKDELSQQLKITQELSKVVDQMANNLTNIEDSYKAQTIALQDLAKVMSSLDMKTVNANFSELNTAFKKSQDSSDKTTDSLKKMVKQQFLAGKETKTLGEQFGKTAKQALVLDAAWSGLKQGFTNFIALSRGAIGAFTSIGDAIVSITASIIAIPIKIFTGLIDLAAKNANGMNELALAVERVRKDFGDLKGPGSSAILTTEKSLKGFSDTGLSAWRVFGTLAERLDIIRETALGMGPTFSVLTKEFRDNGGAILAFQKGLGVANEEMKGIGQRAITMGKPMSRVFLEMTKQTLELGKAFDLDQKLIGKDMAKALQDVKHFGQMTVKEIGQAAVYARKLGVELDKIVGTLDAFETFDSAAENASKLSQSFGVTVDAFQMMEAQSPAEQIEMLRKQFKLAGVDSSTFNRQQLKLISSTTGLDEATAKQVFSQKNQGVSLDAIKKKSEGAEKKTLTQAEAMSKLADSIERMVKSGSMTGSFFDMFIKGILGGIQNTKEFWRIMTNIQQGLQAVYFEGMRLGQAIVKLFPGLKQLMDSIGDFFDPKKFKKLAGGVTDVFIKFMESLGGSGEWSFGTLMDKLKEKFFDFFNMEAPAGKQMVEGFKTVLKTISKIVSGAIKWIADKIGEGIKMLTEFIKDPKKFTDQVKGGAGALGFLGEILMPIADALKHAWKVLWPAMKELFSVVAHKLWDYLKSDEFINIIKPALPIIAAVLFGPAFTKAIVAGMVNAVGSAAMTGIAAAGKKLIGAEKAVESAGAVNKAGGAAIQEGKGWGVKDAVALGAKLVAIAAALAIGGVMMAASVKAMKAIMGDMTLKDVEAPLAVLGAMVLSTLPLMLALKLAKNLGDPADIAVGGLVVTAAVAIVGGVGALLAYVLKKVASPAELEAASGFMLKMSLVFIAMVPLIAAAMGLGVIVTASSGLALVPIAAGMAVIAATTASMMTTAMEIVKELGKLKIDADFQRKVDAFLGIMKSIQAFADTLTKMVGLMTPTFTELLTGKTESFSKKADASVKLLAQLIGKRGAGGTGSGIIGIVEVVIDSIKDLGGGSAQTLESAKIFSDVLTAVSAAMTAMTPPDAFFTAGDSFMSHLNGPKPFQNLATDVAYFSKKMVNSLMLLLTGDEDGKPGANSGGGLISIIKKLGDLATGMPASDKVSSVTSLLNSLTSMMSAVTPPPELVKAFTSASSASAFSLGGADVMKATNSSVDTKGFAKFVSIMQEQFAAMLPLMTGGALKMLIKMADSPDFSPDKLAKITTITGALKNVTDFSKTIQEQLKPTIEAFSMLPDMSKKITSDLSDNGIKNIADTIGQMFKASNEISNALAKMPVVNVAAKLAPIAASLGLGAKGEYKIESKAVNIYVDFSITMNAADLEQSLVLRQNSVIRQRLDTLSELAGAGPRLGTNNYTPAPGAPPALTKGAQ